MTLAHGTLTGTAAERRINPGLILIAVGTVIAVAAVVVAILLSAHGATSTIAAGQPGSAEWRTFRAGERGDAIAPVAGFIGSPEWRAFRAGERGDEIAPVAGFIGSPEWRAFRAGERGDADTTSATAPRLASSTITLQASEFNDQ